MILSQVLNIFKKVLIVQAIFLLLMSIFRAVFFIHYNTIDNISLYYFDLLNSFVLGARIDLTVLGYIQAPITIILIILYYLKSAWLIKFISKQIKYYLFIFYVLVSLLLVSDFGFYSYFKDHINILYFGLFEDDTYALMITMIENYNVTLILSLFVTYLVIVYLVVSKILNTKNGTIGSILTVKNSVLIFVTIFLLNFLAIRGTFGMYPLGKMIPNVSQNDFINNLSQNGVRAFMKAYKIRKKFTNDKYDLIALTGFKNNIKEAFKIYKGTSNIDEENLLNNITYKTSIKKDLKDYNVVVIMVESFGMPILNYNSKEFNIMGDLKKHFDEDTIFKNFISSGDGTISSLESIILNIPYRPGSFAFSQSKYKQTSYKYAPAFIFGKDGYDTTFMYGGDLSWRDIGKFIKYQGFNQTIGKITMFNNLANKDEDKNDYFHPWGIHDEYLYNSVFKKLEDSKKKQFIFALSTNNHPPYTIPKQYKLNDLTISPDLKKHITTDLDLISKRFQSYAYALDSVGKFITKIKNSDLGKNTIVIITADNNTIEGNMKYDKDKLFNSRNIPFYLYLPKELKKTLKIDDTVFGSHKDIFPTLYNIVLSDTKYISIGTNMLDKNATHIGVNGSKIIASKKRVIKVNNLNKPHTQFEVNYYRSSLAIAQYLLNQSYNK